MKGELRLQSCDSCGLFRYPPSAVCPDCGAAKASWTRLKGTGTIRAWATYHRQYLPELPAPYTIVSVEVPEGPLLIGELLGAGNDIRVGQEVVAVQQELNSDEGPWRIWQWTPLGSNKDQQGSGESR